MNEIEVTLPYNFVPRPYQRPIFNAREKDIKHIIQVWHRRGGKDLVDLHLAIMETQKRVGNYWHVFPHYKQGRKAVWQGVTSSGVKYLDAFPKALVKSINKQEMIIEFINGSIWQLVGADEPDSLVGSGICGAVYSEYSLTKPSVREYIRPMLVETDGWEIINFTPRGENHAYELYKMALKNPEWYVSLKTVDDTGIITKEQIQQLREEGTLEEIIQQEYYCSFKASAAGAYYSEQLKRAEDEGRICELRYDEKYPVRAVWDIGATDAVAIWFAQHVDGWLHLIDYEEAEGKDPAYWVKLLGEKPYLYEHDVMPHDANNKRFTAGMKTVKQEFVDLGRRNIVIQPRSNNLIDDINAVRMDFYNCKFDEKNCKQGLNALKNYHKKYDEARNVFSAKPEHDWSSHGADAFRYAVIDFMKGNKDDHYKPLRQDLRWVK